MLLSAIARAAAAVVAGVTALSTSGTVLGEDTDGTSASGQLTFGSTGSITKTVIGSNNNLSSGPTAWTSPVSAGNGAGFWLRVTVVSGALTSGSGAGTWLQGNTTRTWTVGPASSGSASCVVLLEVATDAGGANVVASGNWTIGYSHTGGGGSSASPVLTNQTRGDVQTVTCTFQNDGQLHFNDGPADPSGQWLASAPVASTIADDYDVRFTYLSGPNPSGGTVNGGGATKTGSAYDTWLNLATSRSITLAAFAGLISDAGGGTLRFTAEIRPAGGGATLASATIQLSAAI